MSEVKIVEFSASLSGSRAPLAFPCDGGAKLNLDIPETDEDAAYVLLKNMRGKTLKVTVEAVE
jgi:hypothetical protein